MILRRLGNKTKIAQKIIDHFPPHECYIELFFGAGGLFFNKPHARYNFLNDLDNDVFNLFDVLINRKDELQEMIELIPYSYSVFKYFKKNNYKENPVMQAARFLYLSNYGLHGKPDNIRLDLSNSKQTLIDNIKSFFIDTKNVKFLNTDFRNVLKSISFKEESDKQKTFIYADPPYLKTANNYSDSFTLQDTIDLFDIATDRSIKMAISEFKNNSIINLAKERNLEIIEIGERRTLGSRNTEVLIVNYDTGGLFR